MPTVEDYALLAPFTLEEFVSAANSILRERPSLKVQPRTIRFYISGGLLPRPSGGPKFARYGMEHLRRIVAIRRWLDEGVSLEEASRRLQSETDEAEHSRAATSVLPEQLIPDIQSPRGRTVSRLRLSRYTVLEIDARADLDKELERAIEAIQNLTQTFSTSFPET